MGRTSGYNPEMVILAQGWARDGLTCKQIAENLGIALSTLYEWKIKYPEFAEVLKVNKEIADRHIENALYKSALGFHYREQAVTNKGEVVEVERYEKPNTTAQIFWLKNRKPAQWRDVKQQEISGPEGGPIETKAIVDLTKLSDKELDLLEQTLSKVGPEDTE